MSKPNPADSAPEDAESDAALVARAVLRLGRRLRAERPAAGLTPAALSLLVTLHRRGPMAAVALARAEQLAPQSLSRLISRLDAQRLIARHPDPADRRILVIALTAAGRRAIKRDIVARRAWLEAAMAGTLDAGERGTLVTAAELMLRMAGDA